ncbi:MAG: methyltransferase domain-containing protein [Chloroflexota bacterium]
MERLARAEELLDGPLEDVHEVADNLRDLRRANRLLGGARQSRLAVRRLAGGNEPVTLIDVGTGAADIPVMLLADSARAGRSMRITAIDERAEVIEAARIARPGVERVAGLELVVGDGRSLPYPDGAFDIAHASLVVHHLEPVDAVALLREMARVARRGVVVNDLVRGRLFVLGAWLVSHLATGNRLSRNDAPLSVRRAYSREELRGLCDEAGLRVVGEVGGFVGHRVAIVAVRA